MVDHTCHAIGCETPCPPSLLMCAACWTLVSAASRRKLRKYHPGSTGRRNKRAMWLAAVCHARADVCEARGDYDTATEQRARGDRLLGRALLWATDHETGQAIALANLRTVTEAATQPRPRPLPDGPGRWRGAWDGEEPRCVEVGPSFLASRGLVGDAGAGMLMPVRHEGWTWLAGPDGRAVRCVPPEVDRG